MPVLTHQEFTEPREDCRIWRYMDVAKLLSIISDGYLFFPSGKTLSREDKFEGQPTYAEVNDLNYLASPPQQAELITIRDQLLANFREYAPADQNKQMAIIENITFFSCWHMNDAESDAMWKIYGRNNNGVAIKSTVGRLKKALYNTKEEIYLGRIKYYSEPKNDPNNPVVWVWRYMRKRMAFQHEMEVRAVTTDGTQFGKSGIAIPINVSELIEQIVISPYAEAWLEGLVRALSCRLGYTLEVVRSEAARDIPSEMLLSEPKE